MIVTKMILSKGILVTNPGLDLRKEKNFGTNLGLNLKVKKKEKSTTANRLIKLPKYTDSEKTIPVVTIWNNTATIPRTDCITKMLPSILEILIRYLDLYLCIKAYASTRQKDRPKVHTDKIEINLYLT